MVDQNDLRNQFVEAFEGANYPVSGAEDLFDALPDGLGTTFKSGDLSMTIVELNERAGDNLEFPYESVDAFVDDIMDGLEQGGHL